MRSINLSVNNAIFKLQYYMNTYLSIIVSHIFSKIIILNKSRRRNYSSILFNILTDNFMVRLIKNYFVLLVLLNIFYLLVQTEYIKYQGIS